MKKLFSITIMLFLITIISFSQNLSINTTGAVAAPSAILDISASNLGLLLPRVDLISATDGATISSPATSLLVYNTGTGGLTPAGYYYNSGTPVSPQWAQIAIAGSGGNADCFTNWQLFTSNGTFTVPAGISVIKVEVFGGGGGGGGGGGTARGGGGGGGGGYAVGTFTVTPAQVYTVTIGSGGAGAAGNGSSGGTTTFAATTFTISATFGNGGLVSSTSSTGGAGGAGGLGSGGYMNISLGSGGGGGINASGVTAASTNGAGGGGAGGVGGSTIQIGGGGGGGLGGGNGGSGTTGDAAVVNSGAGGGGGGSGGNSGGNGAAGKAIVYW